MSKEKVFIRHDDDFMYFAEQFIARMPSLKLMSCFFFNWEDNFADYTVNVRKSAFQGQHKQAANKPIDKLDNR